MTAQTRDSALQKKQSVTEANLICDRKALELHRRRALRWPHRTMFLHEIAATECKERIRDINRDFREVFLVTGFPDFWGAEFPNAEISTDSELLEFEERKYDLAIHALALHWANDPIGQLVQCRLALKSDGLLIAAMFGGSTLTELRQCIAEAEAETFGGISPRVAPMAEIRDVGGLLQRAGFALPVADSVSVPVEYRNVRALVADLRSMGETNALAQRSERYSTKRMFEETERIYAKKFAGAGNRIRATFEIIFLTGWVPSANQQQPLRPGSAKARLSDALEAAGKNQ